jgi:hypothetical protein
MITHSSGPAVTTGSIGVTGQTNAGLNPDAGPNVDFHGSAVLDCRYIYRNGMPNNRGQITATLNYAYASTLDAVPSIKSNAIVAAAQTPVVPAGGSVAFTLASTNQVSAGTNGNRAVSIPLVPYVGQASGGTLRASNAVSVMCLDPGHTTGTTSTSSAVVTSVGDTRLITLGQYVCIPGAGSAATSPLIARVVAKTSTNGSGAGTITLDTTPATAGTFPIILMEWRQPTDTTGGASAVWWYYDGAVALFDPHSATARALCITTAGTIASGYTVTISGYDVYGVPMTETITVPTSASTVNGKKAFKYVASATLNFSGGGTPGSTISIGTTDILGLHLKSEFWEYSNIFTNGAFVSANTGWTAAVTTTATATTGDVRGTYALQSASDGSKRTAFFTSLPARQVLGASYDDVSPLYGVAQF